MEWLTDPNIWASLLTLTVLEIVLGIDNLVFIAILAGRLPPEKQDRARRFGLALALISRLALLASISWLTNLTTPLVSVMGHGLSARDLVLIAGGLFLLYKGTREIHERIEGERLGAEGAAAVAVHGLVGIVLQIMVLDIVFSLDSVITAVGMADHLWVMAAAVVIAVIVMLVASGPLAHFIDRHPTVKMLALSFLLLIGMTLIADGIGFHVPKGYIYAAIGFSILVESLNIAASKRGQAHEAATADQRAAVGRAKAAE
jgi:predicted tellurium resistance membrane protein TerC